MNEHLQTWHIGDFVEFVELSRQHPNTNFSQGPADWFVVETEPQQDLTTVWRLHELGLEMFVPVIRRRVKTGRVGRNGHKVTRIIARPMFPGYGFIRAVKETASAILATRGVRDFMRNEVGDFVKLPHSAVLAVYSTQLEKQQEWMQENGGRRISAWKIGDRVRIDEEGGVYRDRLATVDKIDSKGRIQVLLGMIRHTLPADMVVAVSMNPPFKQGSTVKLKDRYAITLSKAKGNPMNWVGRKGMVVYCSRDSVSILWEGRKSLDHVPQKVVEIDAVNNPKK